jgi:hypothetical protein
MPLNTQIYVDDSRFVAFVDGMKSKRVRGLEKQALRKTGNLMRSEAVRSLRRAKGKVLSNSEHGKEWYKGIKASVGKDKNGNQYWQVHIMGYYMLKWFEKGTVIRRTKKSRYLSYQKRTLDTMGNHEWIHKRGTSPHATGQIKPIWFFKTAADRNKDRLVENMQSEWKKIIVKEFIKKNGI